MSKDQQSTENKQGFTLIELIVTVAIVGVLSAIAIPSFVRFIQKSKTSEAPLNMRQISDGAIAWYHRDHFDAYDNSMASHFPHSRSPSDYPLVYPAVDYATAPTDFPCQNGGAEYAKNSNNWASEPWISLKFGIAKSHYYRYGYDSSGSSTTAYFKIEAAADLDCDSSKSAYWMKGSVVSSGDISLTGIYVFTSDDLD